jgi:hypothetical protein
MHEKNSTFESLLNRIDSDLNERSKQKVDQYLVEIGYLPDLEPGDSIMYEREWDIEYNKITIALPHLNSFEEFNQFHSYVWNKMVGFVPSSNKHHKIWKNKSVWLERYVPQLSSND